MLPSTSPASKTLSAEPLAAPSLAAALVKFLVRRRILLTAVLFGAVIAVAVLRGFRPRDVTNWRDPAVLAGGLLLVSGLGLRSWAVGILHKNRRLTTTGPYQLIRNPLYAGSFLMMFGFCTLIGDWTSALFVLAPMMVVYWVKVRQEEGHMARLFPAEWPDYERSTPRFVPRPACASLRAEWRGAQWLRAREYQAIGATLLALLAIKIWQAVLQLVLRHTLDAREPMRLLTRYVLREILLVFTITLVALTVLMVLWGAVQRAILEGVGLAQIAQFIPFLLPNALMFAVPGTILFSVTNVYGRMSGANEVVALKSLGLSPMVVIWPTLILAGTLSLATVWLNDVAMSWGNRGIQRVVLESLEEIAYGKLRAQRSYSRPEFSVTVMKVEGRKLIKPTFFFQQGTAKLKADSAELRSNGPGKLVISLVNPAGDSKDQSFSIPQVIDREIDLTPKAGRTRPKQLSLSEISRAIEPQLRLIRAIEARMIARSAFQMISGDFEGLKGRSWHDDANKLKDANLDLCGMRTEPPRRWANGFSCACFALVGTAMAIRRRNADALTSFFLCFAPILVVYYPLLIFGKDRASAGAINPYAVWLANGILVLWGLWLMRRVIRY